MIVRPKVNAIIRILDGLFYIDLKPQQKWECEIVHEDDVFYIRKYRLFRDNVTVNFSEEEFQEHFKVVSRND
jgi:hypothetical protein